MGKPLDFQDATVEDVHLVLFRHGEQALADCLEGYGIHQVPCRYARHRRADEPDENAFRHIQGHEPQRPREGYQTRTGRKRNT